MKKFWIDYSCSILVEAETVEEAEKKFWNSCSDDEIAIGFGEMQIDGIEEKEEDD